MNLEPTRENTTLNFSVFIGQEKIKQALLSRLKRQQVGHAYLFVAPEGQGKATLAHIFAASILCLRPDFENGACGVCTSCRKFFAGVHPDFFVLGQEEKSIKIDQVREIKETVHFSPNDANRKVYLVEHAENMTRESANSLLKVLEDPPAYLVFILTAVQEQRVLPTVISRCEYYRFGAYTEAEINQILTQAFPEYKATDLENVASEAGGLLFKARQMLNEEAFLQLKEKAEKMSVRVSDMDMKELLQWAEELDKSDRVADFLALLNQYFLQQLTEAVAKEQTDDFEKIQSAMEVILSTQGKLQTNVNRLLALEAMLLEIKEVMGDEKLPGRRREI